MDNVTHTLAGALIAEAVILLHARRSSGLQAAVFRRAALLTSLFANNLPDADILYTSITPAPLGYLLHHRGHTHTLPFALLLGALSALVVIAVLRWKWTISRSQGIAIASLGLIGPLAHIGMDAGNVYGVHPFWPLHDGWFYGDSVFILEPLFWMTALPALIAQARTPAWRVVLAGILTLGVALPWLLPAYVPLGIRLLIAALALAFSVAAWKTGPLARVTAAGGAWISIALLFIGTGAIARQEMRDALQASFPSERVFDIALSPLPANPLCWTAITISTDPNESLSLRRAMVATAPGLLQARRCPPMTSGGSAPTSPITIPDQPGLEWHDEFRAPLAELERLAAERCEVRALLRFVRVPYWSVRPDDGARIVGDLRFDRSAGADFADLAIPNGPSVCPPFVPPWVPPRADLLR